MGNSFSYYSTWRRRWVIIRNIAIYVFIQTIYVKWNYSITFPVKESFRPILVRNSRFCLYKAATLPSCALDRLILVQYLICSPCLGMWKDGRDETDPQVRNESNTTQNDVENDKNEMIQQWVTFLCLFSSTTQKMFPYFFSRSCHSFLGPFFCFPFSFPLLPALCVTFIKASLSFFTNACSQHDLLFTADTHKFVQFARGDSQYLSHSSL
jgi:hypothetical protein